MKTPGTRPQMTPDYFNSRSAGHLPGLVGLTILSVGPEGIESRLDVRKDLMAPKAAGFTTLELNRCAQMVLWPK